MLEPGSEHRGGGRMMSRLQATFRSLGNHNFRVYLTAHAVSVTGSWVQKIGQVWLVLELSGSGTMLGVTAALQHLPTLVVGPWGGLIADRVDKRKILIRTQAGAGLLALGLGWLTATGLVELWMVLLFALCLGTVTALDRPARDTFVYEMVGPIHLTNAVTLHSIVKNGGKSVGPAIAGALIAGVGVAASFVLNGLSYFAVVVALLLLRNDQLRPAVPVKRAPGQLRDGLRYARRTPELLAPLLLMTVAGMMAYEWTVSIPLLARDAFDGDAQTFGVMFSAVGIGAVIGGLFIAGSARASMNTLTATALLFSLTLAIVAAAPTLPVALVALLFLGVASMAFKALASALVQLVAEPEMRGRSMALLAIATGGTSLLGAPLVGWVGDVYGGRIALALGSISTALAAILTLQYARRWRGKRPSEPTTHATASGRWSEAVED